MDNQEGKRVIPKKGMARGAKIALIVVIIAIIVFCAGFAGVSYYAGSSGKLLPNTEICGIPVGGMTPDRAAETVQSQLEQRLSSLTIPFICSDKEYIVSGSDFTVDAAQAVEAALSAQSGGFLSRGIQYISSLLGGNSYSAAVTLAATPQAVTQALEECTDSDAQTTWRVTSEDLILTKGRTGRTVDADGLIAALTEQAGRLLNDSEPAEYASIEAKITTAPPADPDFDAIYDEVYVAPADAHLDAETKELVESVTGVSFDISAARTLLEHAEEGAQVSVPLLFEAPALTTEALNEKLFADVLGTSTTQCAGPSTRWYNIDLAASRVNGAILLPGETFSYNDHCEPYSESGGYKKAGAYVGGKNIDTTAGGICQLSSTLYWTTLKANLEIVERNQHRYNSGYMPVVGTDATVYSDSLDFKFKNSTEYPIKVECYQDKNHTLHVTIYGTDTTGIHGEPYSVTLSTVAYKNIYKPDASKVPVGGAPVRDQEYARYNGITVEVYQKLVDKDGNTVSTTFLYKNTYKPSDPVYYYNPADAARLGIDPATGLMTLTPVTPTPSPSPSPTPDPLPSPSTDPSVSPTPDPPATTSPDPSVSPSPEPVVTPSPEPTPETGPGMEPVDDPLPTPSATPLPVPSEPPAESIPLD